MKRRNFLQTAAVFGLPTIVPIAGLSASKSSLFTSLIAPESDRVLVIVHLFGGNDGLNTVIPLDQYAGLTKVRPLVYIENKLALKVNDNLALHPRMTGMQNMFSDGNLNIVQSVGYPKQNRSHFRSTDIWTSGSSADDIERTGWFGRYLDKLHPGFPVGYPSSEQPHPPAISLGNVAHASCEGANINFSQTVVDPNNVTMLAKADMGATSNDFYGTELDFIRTTITQTNAYNTVISKATDAGRNTVSYPSGNTLADQLKEVARMISGGLQTKVYTVYLGGFDTHAKQVTPDTSNGNHANSLREVSDAISAFQKDIKQLGLDDRVLGMTFSEFGRRIRQNASQGTDHGDAGPMFLFGGCVNGGVIGDNVEVHPDVPQTEGVPMQIDFRDVYGSILVDWFNVKSTLVKQLLHQEFKYMPLVGKCNEELPDSTDVVTEDGWTIGDPFSNSSNEVRITISSPSSSKLRYSLFDGRGRLVLANEISVSGTADYSLFTRPTRLPSGSYVLRMATGSGSTSTRKVVFD